MGNKKHAKDVETLVSLGVAWLSIWGCGCLSSPGSAGEISKKTSQNSPKCFTTCSLLAGMQVPGFSGTTSPSCTLLFFHQWFISRCFSWGKQVHHGTSQACFGSKQMVRYPMISPFRTSVLLNSLQIFILQWFNPQMVGDRKIN